MAIFWQPVLFTILHLALSRELAVVFLQAREAAREEECPFCIPFCLIANGLL